MIEDDALRKAQKIEDQVERWDLFAKLVPTLFLFGCFVSLAVGVGFEILFNIGMIAFASTAVVWWFWAIFSIRYLVKIFKRAAENLIKVSDELSSIKNEYKELRDEENRGS
mgnify:CR=1 FL=1